MATCFDVFIYAITRPADTEVHFTLHCVTGNCVIYIYIPSGMEYTDGENWNILNATVRVRANSLANCLNPLKPKIYKDVTK
jgi:hypothetical protein